MKLRLSILLNEGVTEGTLNIVDAAGATIGFLNQDNANAVIELGHAHVVYVGPRPGNDDGETSDIISGAGTNNSLASTIVGSTGAAASAGQTIVSVVSIPAVDAGTQIAMAMPPEDEEIAKLEALLVTKRAAAAAHLKEVDDLNPATHVDSFQKVEGEVQTIAKDAASFFPGA
jgi:hypothetical protein